MVLTLAASDITQGRPSWGRAGRIARKLDLSERSVRRYLKYLATRAECPKAKAYNGLINLEAQNGL